MKQLFIDIETYSDVDLQKCGVYRYVESNAFEILLFGYAIDKEPIQVIDLAAGEKLSDELIAAICNNAVTKWAHNASFERICLSAYFHVHYLDPSSWRCSMIWAAYLSMPLSLQQVGTILNLDKQKMNEGKDLVRYFCLPCKPTKANHGRTRNLPKDDPESWAVFKAYNKRDVETEMGIMNKLSRFPVPEFVWHEYHIDQQINDRGILIDLDLAKSAITLDKISRNQLMTRLQQITHLENPNSVMQIKSWLESNGLKVDSLGKKNVTRLIAVTAGKVKQVLQLRSLLSKSSTKKYQVMLDTVCSDGRARGMFQFYGATHTGRFSGKKLQLQNLPQNHIPDLDAARTLAKASDFGILNLLYDSVPDTLSQLIRTAFIPRCGYQFIVSDFSAIEARVLSWLAQEQWRMDVFANNGDIYCETASHMFHCTVVKHGENGELRQKGKQAELACGYGGSVGALKAMGALDLGMKEEELQPLVDSWRQANPKIVRFWWDVDRAIREAVSYQITAKVGCLHFIGRRNLLQIVLPSGRSLFYVHPLLSSSISYIGVTANKKWDRIDSYGPKFVENITQAISRDILCFAMKNLEDQRIVAHVHDELIIECPREMPVSSITSIMSLTPPWAPGLILRADGYSCPYYQKD
jgi:DNA polymerase